VYLRLECCDRDNQLDENEWRTAIAFAEEWLHSTEFRELLNDVAYIQFEPEHDPRDHWPEHFEELDEDCEELDSGDEDPTSNDEEPNSDNEEPPDTDDDGHQRAAARLSRAGQHHQHHRTTVRPRLTRATRHTHSATPNHFMRARDRARINRF
jgi:hypothetical protein